jgi:hypothetical protein
MQQVVADTATVTVNRNTGDNPNPKCSDPFISLTCEFRWLEGQNDWILAGALDEDGNRVQLTAAELHLARCLVEAGVDETGV